MEEPMKQLRSFALKFHLPTLFVLGGFDLLTGGAIALSSIDSAIIFVMALVVAWFVEIRIYGGDLKNNWYLLMALAVIVSIPHFTLGIVILGSLGLLKFSNLKLIERVR